MTEVTVTCRLQGLPHISVGGDRPVSSTDGMKTGRGKAKHMHRKPASVLICPTITM